MAGAQYNDYNRQSGRGYRDQDLDEFDRMSRESNWLGADQRQVDYEPIRTTGQSARLGNILIAVIAIVAAVAIIAAAIWFL